MPWYWLMQIVRVPDRAPASSLRSAARASKVSISMNAIVCERLLASRLKELRSCSTDSIGAGARRENYKSGKTYINDILDLSEYGRDWLTNERNSLEQTSLANEDVEERLVNTDKLFLCVSYIHISMESDNRTSRKASKTASVEAPAGSLGMPCIWAMAVVAVVTMSEKPRMILGNGPCPIKINGPLTTLISLAGACRARLFCVIDLMLVTTSAGVIAAEIGTEKAKAAVKKLRNETMIAVVRSCESGCWW